MAQAPSGMSEVSIRRRRRDRWIVERRPPRMFAFATCVGVNLCHAGSGVVLTFRPGFPPSRLPSVFAALPPGSEALAWGAVLRPVGACGDRRCQNLLHDWT